MKHVHNEGAVDPQDALLSEIAELEDIINRLGPERNLEKRSLEQRLDRFKKKFGRAPGGTKKEAVDEK